MSAARIARGLAFRQWGDGRDRVGLVGGCHDRDQVELFCRVLSASTETLKCSATVSRS
jgi:hypothetical protein